MTPTIIGSKAFNLLKLEAMGVRVKPFVPVTVEEISDAVASGRVCDGVRNRLKHITHESAVRSSAVSEDGNLSWAGQFTSKLNVKPVDIESAILECAKASSSSTVSSYRKLHQTDEGGLALFVQEMVRAEIAGVLFSADPSGMSDCIIVECVSGTADRYADGSVTPRRYFLDRTGSVVKEEGPDGAQLSDVRLQELIETAHRIRTGFGVEVDIEWAIERDSGLLFINQTRPITSLQRLERNERARAITATEHALAFEAKRLKALGCELNGDVLSDQNIVELLSSHPSQMAFGLFTYCFAHGDGAIRTMRREMGYEIGSELDTGFFNLVAGQPRCSIVHDAFSYRIRGIPLPDYCKLINGYLKKIGTDPSFANYPEVVLYDQYPSRDLLIELFGEEKAEHYRAAYDRFMRHVHELEKVAASECEARFLPSWTETIDTLGPYAGISLEAAVKEYANVCNLLRTRACTAFVKVARLGFFAYARLRNTLLDNFDVETANGYLNTLTSTFPLHCNPNVQFSLALFQLHRGETTIDEVIKTFGHLAERELEISVPRYRERPEILRMLSTRITESPADRLEAGEKVITGLRTKLSEQLGPSLDRDAQSARLYMGLREVVKFHYLRGYDVLRQLAKMIERELDWEEDLIFQLEPTEVFKLPLAATELLKVAIERKEVAKRNAELPVPPVLFSDNLAIIGRLDPIDRSKALRGISATTVVCEGEVVIVRHLSDTEAVGRLRPGSILVTPCTDPAWAPAIEAVGKTGALVTEVGGMLCHGAILAQEIGMASVVNVPNATAVLADGMRVRVDGPAGLIEIL